MSTLTIIVLILTHLACLGLGALGNHWLRKNKPVVYDAAAAKAKELGDKVEAKLDE